MTNLRILSFHSRIIAHSILLFCHLQNLTHDLCCLLQFIHTRIFLAGMYLMHRRCHHNAGNPMFRKLILITSAKGRTKYRFNPGFQTGFAKLPDRSGILCCPLSTITDILCKHHASAQDRSFLLKNFFYL